MTSIINKVAREILNAGDGCTSGAVYVSPHRAAQVAIETLDREQSEELQGYHRDMLGLILALDEMLSVYWGDGDGQLPEPRCVMNAKQALQQARRAKAIQEIESEFDDMSYRFSCVLDHATGGRLSKTNYTKEVMYSEINDHVRRCIDDERDEIIEECIAAMPSTAEDPHESQYQYGYFRGVVDYQAALQSLKGEKE